MPFCTFFTFAQKIFKERGLNFTWCFLKVICTKSMKIVFVASMIRNRLCMIYVFFYYFCPKSFFTENYFLIAAINLTTRGPLYTCLVSLGTKRTRCSCDESTCWTRSVEENTQTVYSHWWRPAIGEDVKVSYFYDIVLCL